MSQPALFDEPKFPTPAEGELVALRERVPILEQRILFILQQACIESRNCSACQAPIYFIQTQLSRKLPFNPDGSTHWETCPNAEEFRRKRQEKKP